MKSKRTPHHQARRPRASSPAMRGQKNCWQGGKYTRQLIDVDPRKIYAREVVDLKPTSGDWAIGLCPFHDDHHPSFAANLVTGAYVCHATHCGARGGNAFGFLMRRYGLDPQGVCSMLEQF